jgi:fatty acid desaturase
MLLLVRWVRSGRGGGRARAAALVLLLALIALLVVRIAASGWSGVGAVPAFVIVALIGWRIALWARRRRAWPKQDMETGVPGTPQGSSQTSSAPTGTTGTPTPPSS